MVIAAKIASRLVEPLAVVGAAKLAPPDHERVVEHTSRGEVLHERGCRLVGLPALARDARFEDTVMVPVLVVELDEPYAPFGEPPRQQAVGRERAGVFGVGAVHLEHVGGLVGEVGHLRHARLHPEGHLVVGDPGGDLRVGRACKLVLVQLPEAVEQLPAVFRRHSRRIVHVEHWVATGAEPHGLMLRREKPRAPEVAHQRLAALVFCDQHDERGEVFMVVAKAVVEPGADTRAARDLRTALHERHTRAMVDAFGVHRADEAEAVGDLRRVREKLRQPGAARAVLAEREG